MESTILVTHRFSFTFLIKPQSRTEFAKGHLIRNTAQCLSCVFMELSGLFDLADGACFCGNLSHG